MPAAHAPSFEFDRRRMTICQRYSPREAQVIPAQTIVRMTLRGTTARMTGERQVKPLQIAKTWDEVTCKGCAKLRSLFEANHMRIFEAEEV